MENVGPSWLGPASWWYELPALHLFYSAAMPGHSLLKLRKARPDQRWVGAAGMDSRKYRICGEAGAELTIPVPTGTTVWLEQHQKLLGEINCAGDKVLVARGGQGSNPSNQYNGQKGQGHIVKLELKLLADVGLVGFPNAGKSTLLWAISRARPKVASYPFTTLQPTLGVVEYSDMRRLTIADLPGLIEGAWANVGMGHRFLRHVERTHFLLFVVDINGFRLSPKQPYRSPTENVMLVNRELELYSPDLLSKPALLMVNKMDSPNAESRLQELLHNIKRMEDYVLCCSCGAKLTENSWDNFVNISIPLSEASQLVTILGHPHLMVQTLRNPADLAFDLVTVRSGLLRSGRGYLNQKPKPAQLTSKLPWRVSMDSF